MIIVWDEPKRIANLAKHGVDFADLDEGFFAGAIVVPARTPRRKAMGLLNGNLIAVIFLLLGTEGLSIISARPASRTERRMFP